MGRFQICTHMYPTPTSIHLCLARIMAEASNSSSGSSTQNPRTPLRSSGQQPKRIRGSPTLLTPHRPQKRRPLRGDGQASTPTPRRLGFESPTHAPVSQHGNAWTDAETKALVEFVLITCRGDSWPCHKRANVWKDAADFVRKRTNVTRTSKFIEKRYNRCA